MSGFFGIFRPQGGPVDLEAFEQMKTAIHRDGFDGMETHVEEKIAMGHLMLRVSPESKFDKQPLKSLCGNYILVGHFRLDYRDELGDKLGMTQSELEVTPDSQLAMLAYQKWKDKCVHHLEGDWAFALYDIILNLFFIAKDPMGYSVLYFTKFQDAFYFSSDFIVFKEVKNFINKIDRQQLFFLFVPGLLPTSGKTLFSEVFRLKNANFIKINFRCEVFENQYWELGIKRETKFKMEEDYIFCLESHLQLAIRSAVRKSELSNGIMLSSGFDSTLVSYFLANELKHMSFSITSYTSFPAFLDDLPTELCSKYSEKLLVEEFVSTQNIKSNYCSFPGVSQVDLLKSNYTNNITNPLISANTFWIDGIIKKAAKDGVKRMFTAQAGNLTVSWNGPLVELNNFIRFNFRTSIRNLTYLSKVMGLNLFSVFKNNILRPAYLIIYVKRKLISKRKLIKTMTNSIFSDSFFKSVELVEVKKEMEKWPSYAISFNAQKMRELCFLNLSSYVGEKWYLNGNNYGIEFSDPTSEKRLVEYSFSLPEKLFNKNGIPRYIASKILTDKLNKSYYNLNRRIPQSYDIGLRIQNDADLKKLIDDTQKKYQNDPSFNFEVIKSLYLSILENEDLLSKRSLSEKLLNYLSVLLFFEKNYKIV